MAMNKTEQRELEKYKADCEYWKKQAIAVKEKTSGVFWDDYHEQVYLPNFGHVCFQVGNDTIQVSLEKDCIKVYHHGVSMNGIMVIPDCSNVVKIAPRTKETP